MIFIYEKVILKTIYNKSAFTAMHVDKKNENQKNRDEIYMKTVKFASKSPVNNQFPFYSCRAEGNHDLSP